MSAPDIVDLSRDPTTTEIYELKETELCMNLYLDSDIYFRTPYTQSQYMLPGLWKLHVYWPYIVCTVCI